MTMKMAERETEQFGTQQTAGLISKKAIIFSLKTKLIYAQRKCKGL
jgi:hypothetical protein